MTNTTEFMHVVLGDHAANLLRSAIADCGLPGSVHCIPDDLGHGPLDDGVARIAYMRACYEGFDEWRHTQSDAFAPWHALENDVQTAKPDVAIWAAGNASEGVLLAMTCWWLRRGVARLHLVEPGYGRHLGRHSPSELAALWQKVRLMTAAERADHTRLFEQLRDAPSQRRQWAGDHVEAVPNSTFDSLLTAEIKSEWSPAIDVVGRAMREADPRNGLSDLYLASRLQRMIKNGSVETNCPPLRLSGYAVRTAAD